MPPSPNPLPRLLAWFLSLSSAAFIAFSWLLPDLGDEGRFVEPLNWLAFCGRTFGLHIAIALFLILLLMLGRKLWRPAMLTSAVALWCLWPTLWSLRPRGEAPTTSKPTLTVYSVNAQVNFVDPALLLAEIKSLSPDLIIIQEHNPRVQTILPDLRETYPHIIEAMREDAFGMAILSKFPFVGPPQTYPYFGIALQLPQIRTVIDINGTEIVVQGIHTLPPVSLSYLSEQRQQIRALAKWVPTESRPLIIAGDFNCTPESVAMRWMKQAGMSDAYTQLNPGRGSTWPMNAGLFSLIGVKIDYLLLGNGLTPLEAQTGQPINSDHRSLFAKIALP